MIPICGVEIFCRMCLVQSNISSLPVKCADAFLLDKQGRIVAEMEGMREWTDEKSPN